MAKAQQENSKISSPLDVLESGYGPLTTAIQQTFQAWSEACIEWQQEVMRFASARFEEDRRAQAAFASSKDMADLAKVQQEWGLKASSDFLDEAARLTQIATKFAQAGMVSCQAAEAAHKEFGYRHAAD